MLSDSVTQDMTGPAPNRDPNPNPDNNQNLIESFLLWPRPCATFPQIFVDFSC